MILQELACGMVTWSVDETRLFSCEHCNFATIAYGVCGLQFRIIPFIYYLYNLDIFCLEWGNE